MQLLLDHGADWTARYRSGETPLHLAAALGTPSLGLFGPTRAERNGPYGPLGRGVQSLIAVFVGTGLGAAILGYGIQDTTATTAAQQSTTTAPAKAALVTVKKEEAKPKTINVTAVLRKTVATPAEY